MRETTISSALPAARSASACAGAAAAWARTNILAAVTRMTRMKIPRFSWAIFVMLYHNICQCGHCAPRSGGERSGPQGAVLREDEGDGEALAEVAVHLDRRVVPFGDLLDEGEAEAGAARMLRIDVVDLAEGQEGCLDEGRRQADAVVGDGNIGAHVSPAVFHPDPAAPGGELDGVVEEVLDRKLHELAVGAKQQLLAALDQDL